MQSLIEPTHRWGERLRVQVEIAAQQGLSPLDAEILTTYVVGMYCPDVR